MTAVRHQLEEEEREAIVNGRLRRHETSASAFLALGITLEQTQYVVVSLVNSNS